MDILGHFRAEKASKRHVFPGFWMFLVVFGGFGACAGDKDDQLSASQLRARHGVQNGTGGSGGDGGMRLAKPFFIVFSMFFRL